MKLHWPDLTFGPINLLNCPYLSLWREPTTKNTSMTSNQLDLFSQPIPLAHNRKYRDEGLLWLRATAAYELHSTPIISDAEWDRLTRFLFEHYEELDVYLKAAIPLECLQSSTGSGVNWRAGIPRLILNEVSEKWTAQ